MGKCKHLTEPKLTLKHHICIYENPIHYMVQRMEPLQTQWEVLKEIIWILQNQINPSKGIPKKYSYKEHEGILDLGRGEGMLSTF